ncbi:type II secretion system minor pseudopilin GspH [Leucothrix pacifica]|uniref:Type II secretion system protein H n=1 Tax=Leucothrix pacifica TaxID=1247513 RepID=A0A317CNR6_9GAMM|nr:type II secretion system minor pseudopilin GspH [Leucothrix pacifica]PWQ99979.1 type II secretion system protein GspH [Leucothrix pacifica]
MLMSRPHRFSIHHHQQGYTLIELMVVIAIMGLLTSVVLPYLPGDKQELLFEELDRFESRVSYAQTHAVLQSQDLGLVVDEGEYRFMQRGKSGWELIEEQPLQAQKIPEFLRQLASVEGQELIVEDSLDGEVPAPKLLFLSSGEITPFTYQLSLSEEIYSTLEYDPLGELKRESFNESE